MEKRNQVSTFTVYIGLRLRASRVPPRQPCVCAPPFLFLPPCTRMQRRSVTRRRQKTIITDKRATGGTMACSGGSYRDKTSFRTPFSRRRHLDTTRRGSVSFRGLRRAVRSPRTRCPRGLGPRRGGSRDQLAAILRFSYRGKLIYPSGGTTRSLS